MQLPSSHLFVFNILFPASRVALPSFSKCAGPATPMALYSHYFTIRNSLDFINGLAYRQALKFGMDCNGRQSVSDSCDSLTGIYSCKKLLVQRRKIFSLFVELVEIIHR